MSEKHQPFIKWFPSDWRADPRLRMCGLAARGLWIELIGYMHEGEPYGFLTINGIPPSGEDIAALVGRPIGEVRKAMAELQGRQVFSMSDDKIFSRRMVRDKAKVETDKTNGANGGNPFLRRGTVPKEQRVRPYRRSDAPEKTARIFAKNDGKCHWCEVPLIFQPDGSRNGFHVDHLLPICDGGTNDEENLIPSCADCNHKRARLDDPTASPVNVGNHSDIKAHIPEARVQKRNSYDEKFEEAWQAYPKRDGGNPKLPAEKRFLAAVKAGADPQIIIDGIKRYAVAEAKNIGTPFIPQMVKWLGDQRWNDYGAGQTATVFNIRGSLV